MKEVQYFHRYYEKGDRWYRARFPLASSGALVRRRTGVAPAVGETSPDYLFDPRAPGRVYAFDPEMKLIAVLRDPVERAYSHWRMERRRGREPLSFEDALDREEAELEQELELLLETPGYRDVPFRMSYAARGRYAEQLERWLALFPREQVLVLESEEVTAHPEEAASRIAHFLGVPEWQAERYPLRGAQGEEAMPPETRERLATTFVEPNRALESMLGRTLGWTPAGGRLPERCSRAAASHRSTLAPVTKQAQTSLSGRMRQEAGRAHWIFRRATSRLRLRPTFLVLGAQKSGTTSLHRYLAEHPAVLRASPKEVRYFSRVYDRGDGWYRAQFPLRARRLSRRAQVGVWPAVGEASPQYLFHPLAPARVHAFDPGMKLIAVLRDPVDRAYSQYQMQLRWGFEPGSFEDALDREEAELDAELAKFQDDPPVYSTLVNRISYVARGRYAEQLERWLTFFPREQLLVLLSDDLADDPGPRCCASPTSSRFPSVAPRATHASVEAVASSSTSPWTRRHASDSPGRSSTPNRQLAKLLDRELPWTRPTLPLPRQSALAPEPATSPLS